MSEHKFHFPAVHITKIVEEHGELFEEAISGPVCDFCYDSHVAWEHPCKRFELDEIDFRSDGAFAACAFCSLLIDLAAWSSLERRILQSWIDLGVTPYATMLKIYTQSSWHSAAIASARGNPSLPENNLSTTPTHAPHHPV